MNSARLLPLARHALLAAAIALGFVAATTTSSAAPETQETILARVQAPVFPERDFLINDHGADAAANALGKPKPNFITSDTPLNLQMVEGTVNLSWTLPEGDIRKVEVCRHVLRRIEGRRRVATIAKDATTWSEPLPDTKRNHWYWIKVTLADDTVINIGPTSTKTVTK